MLRQLAALRDAGYSPEARALASRWATPHLIDWPFGELEEGIYPLLYLLGAADLLGGPPELAEYLYGPTDFDAAERTLGGA